MASAAGNILVLGAKFYSNFQYKAYLHVPNKRKLKNGFNSYFKVYDKVFWRFK